MTNVLSVMRQATLTTTGLMCSVITANIHLATSPKTVQTKSLLREYHITKTGHASNHVTTTAVGTYDSPLTTDTTKEDALTSQDHTTNHIMVEALATSEPKYPTPHPATTAAHATHQLTDATLGQLQLI